MTYLTGLLPLHTILDHTSYKLDISHWFYNMAWWWLVVVVRNLVVWVVSTGEGAITGVLSLSLAPAPGDIICSTLHGWPAGWAGSFTNLNWPT